jgi:hypothetical protein
MGPKLKIAITILLIIVVIIALWQFTSPRTLPPVGDKYTAQSIYTNRGTWIILENMTYGSAYIAFSIANESYPRTALQTYYTLTISNLNQSITESYAKGFGLRVTSITMQDNYDGSTSHWGIGDSLTDAIQATGVFNFQTSGLHKLRITVNYQLYDLLLLGSIPDKTRNDSFNITQTVL